jgi:exodeoxyribonuclease X
MQTAVVFDTEVNSLDAKECIELAYAVVEMDGMGELNFHGAVAEQFEPLAPCDAGAVAIHHINPESLRGRRKSAEASEAVGLNNEFVIAHNVDFDCEVLGITESKRICTLALSRHLWPEFGSHKLGAVYLYLNGISAETIEVIKGAHSAGEDVLILSNILGHIVRKSGVRSFQQLYELSEVARVPVVWPFGKHVGVRFNETPRGYLKWARENMKDADPYLMKAINAAKGV